VSGRSDFTDEEWALVIEAPPLAGMVVATAARGGTFRESIAMGKAYAEARQQHGQSELLDEITHARPKVEHKRFSSFEELKQHGLERVRAAVSLLEGKAAPEEVDAYRGFVVSLAERVAAAHREDGVEVSEPERAAIAEIASAAGATAG
jgi:hypothetical protein